MEAKLRYSSREAMAALGIGNTKFWALVKSGRLTVYRDGSKCYVSRSELERYDAECQAASTAAPVGAARAEPGVKGVQAPAKRGEPRATPGRKGATSQA